ncbi:MAG: hypothetical protein HPY76_12295 [Anaerolineae bacterium]|nr:hypothetical protein [Anaerolineae bacterium]
MKKPTQPDKSRSKSTQAEDAPASSWVDRVAGVSFRFERFSRDVFGIFLIVFALASLLGVTHLSQGSLITPWSNFIRLWLGWGVYPVIVIFIILGVSLTIRKSKLSTVQKLSRILAVEGWIFTLMALFSISGGHSLDRAEAGLDGGVIGWGLVRLFGNSIPLQFITFMLFFALGLFSLIMLGGFGLTRDRISKIVAAIRNAFPSGAPPESPLASQPASTRANPRTSRNNKPEELPAPPVLPNRKDAHLPPLNLLVNEETIRPDSEDIHGTAELIEQTLSEFGVPARVTGYRVGPTVTQFAVEPGFIDKTNANGEVIQQKVRVSQISGLARDLALRLSAQRLRIEAPVAGQSFVGIEVPNDRNSMVRLRSMLESTEFSRAGSSMAIALGKDVSGLSVIGDLITMPHILIAGTTGSGKSICIQAITMCLVMNNTPADLRIAMLDPKMVELARFNGLPHMLGQVETKPERMIAVLSWALAEMGERYKLLEMHNARDLDVYNRKIARKGETPLPRIVIIIDELADLMMSMPEQTEHALVRLAQMARATGIHLVVATQRPSTNVITGLIKANFPTRISFSVASSVDSRVILDTTGAETLLGRGDLLYLNPEVGTPIRAQGVYVTDREIERVVNFWQKLEASDDTTIPWEEMVDQLAGGEDEDAMLSKAIAVIKKSQKASASLLQRRLHVGYPRAARMIDQLEGMGLVGPAQPGGREREVLVDPDDDGEPIGLDED